MVNNGVENIGSRGVGVTWKGVDRNVELLSTSLCPSSRISLHFLHFSFSLSNEVKKNK